MRLGQVLHSRVGGALSICPFCMQNVTEIVIFTGVSHQFLQEPFMQPGIARKFGMKSERHMLSILNCDHSLIYL